MQKPLSIVAIIFSSIFTGACLVVGLVLVPYWRALEPFVFLEYFSQWGPYINQSLITLESLGQISLILACYELRHDEESLKWWLLSATVYSLTFLLLLVFFSKANLGMMTKTIDLAELPRELALWQLMHWLRTLLALAATVLAMVATLKQREASASKLGYA